jgi:hypothetical protein
MQMLSEDDLDIKGLTRAELDAAWDLWFDLAQTTNDADPPYTHGVFAGGRRIGDLVRQGPQTTAVAGDEKDRLPAEEVERARGR